MPCSLGGGAADRCHGAPRSLASFPAGGCPSQQPSPWEPSHPACHLARPCPAALAQPQGLAARRGEPGVTEPPPVSGGGWQRGPSASVSSLAPPEGLCRSLCRSLCRQGRAGRPQGAVVLLRSSFATGQCLPLPEEQLCGLHLVAKNPPALLHHPQGGPAPCPGPALPSLHVCH